MNETLLIGGLIIYIILASVVAYLSRRGDFSSMSGYFIGNRKMNGILSALSYSATTYSAFMMVGLAGLTYAGGVGALGFEIIYFTGVSLVTIFGPKFWLAGKKFGCITPAELLGNRYASRAVAVTAALVSCLFLIPYCAVQLAGVGYLLQGMSGGQIDFTVGVIVATALAILFSFASGIRSVVWTDSLQAIIMIFTSTFVALLLISQLGGFASFFHTLKTEHPDSLVVPGNGFFNIFTFVSLTVPWFFFSLSNPQVSQRLFMPDSLKGLRHMLLGFLVFGFIYTFVSVLWGFAAIIHFPDLSTADLATPKLLSSSLVPPLLDVIVMIGIVAAAVSTIDSILLTLSSLVARDVYGNLKKETTDYAQLAVGKIVIPLIAVLAFLFARMQLDLIAVLSVAASSGLLVTVPAFIGAFFWKKGTAAGALTAMICGSFVVLLLEGLQLSPFQLGSGVWGLIVSTMLFVFVSLLTKAPLDQANAYIDELKKEEVRFVQLKKSS